MKKFKRIHFFDLLQKQVGISFLDFRKSLSMLLEIVIFIIIINLNFLLLENYYRLYNSNNEIQERFLFLRILNLFIIDRMSILLKVKTKRNLLSNYRGLKL